MISIRSPNFLKLGIPEQKDNSVRINSIQRRRMQMDIMGTSGTSTFRFGLSWWPENPNPSQRDLELVGEYSRPRGEVPLFR
ncbi:hypothetical protein PM082_020923 [Marasmius tenuissimus]|nr:hypothetical protein PM082_020923 [Marasmius tenuissimus]